MRYEYPVKIFGHIAAERLRQNEKWGEQNWKPSEWLSILGEEYGEVCRAVYEMELNPPEKRDPKWWLNYREELVHVAAVAVQMLECFDRHSSVDASFLPPSQLSASPSRLPPVHSFGGDMNPGQQNLMMHHGSGSPLAMPKSLPTHAEDSMSLSGSPVDL